MNLNMVDTKKNPLMKREEYEISIDHAGKATPSRQEILKEVAKKTGNKADLVIVDRIFTDAGKSVSKVRALAYAKTEDIPKGKLEKMKSRSKKKAEPAAEAVEQDAATESEEKPAEEEQKKETEEKEPEAPAEEKPEEPKKEEKPAEPEKVEEKKPESE
jgi:ribosomal protein S24E